MQGRQGVLEPPFPTATFARYERRRSSRLGVRINHWSNETCGVCLNLSTSFLLRLPAVAVAVKMSI